MDTTSAQLDINEIVAGFYLARVLDFLYCNGVLDTLQETRRAEDIALEHGWSPQMVTQLLDFVVRYTPFIENDGDGFRIAREAVGSMRRLRHMLDLYVGAFGPCFDELDRTLADASGARDCMDSARHAKAFGAIDRPSFPELADLILQLEIHSVIDLGCGSATLLVDIAKRTKDLRGIGLDSNPDAVAAARVRIDSANLSGRLSVMQADVRNLGMLPFNIDAEALVVVSLLNEFFRTGPELASAFLRQIREVFPARVLFVADYYGRLGSSIDRGVYVGPTLLHDIAQAISGQGIPPSTREDWGQIYEAAGARLLHAIEGLSHGISWFIHVVKL